MEEDETEEASVDEPAAAAEADAVEDDAEEEEIPQLLAGDDLSTGLRPLQLRM